MVVPIDLDDERVSGADEVHDVRPERMLAPEAMAGELALAECPPETAFGVGRIPAEGARSRDATHHPHPRPPPSRGRGPEPEVRNRRAR